MSLVFSILVVVVSKFDFGRLSMVGGWLGGTLLTWPQTCLVQGTVGAETAIPPIWQYLLDKHYTQSRTTSQSWRIRSSQSIRHSHQRIILPSQDSSSTKPLHSALSPTNLLLHKDTEEYVDLTPFDRRSASPSSHNATQDRAGPSNHAHTHGSTYRS
jgi:hypothetical protein